MNPNNTHNLTSLSTVVDPYDRCFDLFEAARSWFKRFDGVVGVGIGPKERNRQVDPYLPCLIIYVREKKTVDEIPLYQLFPKTYGGVPTDVVVPGERLVPAHNAFDESWLEWEASEVVFDELG